MPRRIAWWMKRIGGVALAGGVLLFLLGVRDAIQAAGVGLFMAMAGFALGDIGGGSDSDSSGGGADSGGGDSGGE